MSKRDDATNGERFDADVIESIRCILHEAAELSSKRTGHEYAETRRAMDRLCDVGLASLSERATPEDPAVHGFTMRDAIKDGLPPSTALVLYDDYFALWQAQRSATATPTHGPRVEFIAAVRAFVSGGVFDLTDSQESLVSSLKRIVNELDRAEGRV